GMQPRRMQSPPNSFAPSTIATRFPSSRATRAPLKPAEPPPITTRSYAFAAITRTRSFRIRAMARAEKHFTTEAAGVHAEYQCSVLFRSSADSALAAVHARRRSPGSVREPDLLPLPGQHQVHRLQHDRRIHREREVTQVIQVVLE